MCVCVCVGECVCVCLCVCVWVCVFCVPEYWFQVSSTTSCPGSTGIHGKWVCKSTHASYQTGQTLGLGDHLPKSLHTRTHTLSLSFSLQPPPTSSSMEHMTLGFLALPVEVKEHSVTGFEMNIFQRNDHAQAPTCCHGNDTQTNNAKPPNHSKQ